MRDDSISRVDPPGHHVRASPATARNVMKQCPICSTGYTDEHKTCPTDGAMLLVTTNGRRALWVRGKYRIIAKIGRGGRYRLQGRTHRARRSSGAKGDDTHRRSGVCSSIPPGGTSRAPVKAISNVVQVDDSSDQLTMAASSLLWTIWMYQKRRWRLRKGPFR